MVKSVAPAQAPYARTLIPIKKILNVTFMLLPSRCRAGTFAVPESYYRYNFELRHWQSAKTIEFMRNQ